MKKLAAISLVCLLAFNWLGYRLFIDLIEQHSTSELQAKLDREEYEKEGLIELKFALNLPYTINHSEFENYEGETEINGIHYNYVKRKLVNDTLILLCIPNETKNQLRTAKSDYFKNVNDLQQPGKKSNSSKEQSSKTVISDYLLKENAAMSLLQNIPVMHHALYLDILPSPVHLLKDRPPEC